LKKVLFLIIIGLFALTETQAQIITDRPDQTESSATVEPGDLQIESGILIGFEGDAFNSTRQLLAPTTLFRYGVTELFEIRIVSQYETLRLGEFKTQGISDLQVGTKIQFFQDENANTEIAFLSHLVLPSGARELTVDQFGTINKLSISHGLGNKMGIGYNIGYDYFEGRGDLTYSIALGISVNDRVGLYIEPYGAFVELDEHIANFDAGFTYLVNENLQLDYSFGLGINHRMNYNSIGVSWLIKNGFRDNLN